MSEANSVTVGRWAALVLLAVVLGGCGGGVTDPAPTDPKQAATALQACLEKWKSGSTIEALQKETPVVYAADEDWQAGIKLVAFELRDVLGQEAGSTRIPVRLHVQSPNGLWWKEVEYNVTVREKVVSVLRQDAPN
ncbi:MAG: hypothetical protein ACKVP0_09620 [Pirellulaceae bacterium]